VTYLLTGEAPAVRARLDEDTGIETAIRLEDCIDEEGDEEEYVPQTKIVLVGEENLAGTLPFRSLPAD
jgi:hypothetical protein